VARKSEEAPAEIVREYGPFPDTKHVHGVSYDGERVWFAAGERLQSFDPGSGEQGRALAVPASAGTAYDGRYFYQIADGMIRKVEAATGEVVATLPAPKDASASGLTWAEGFLWLGDYGGRKIHQLDAKTGKVLRVIESTRFVTGVTFVDSELWHATLEDGQSDLRRLDPETGEVLERLVMPEGVAISGLESDGADLFYAGGGSSGKVRAVRRPKR
jgi:outer membrane protein assembly factor BamB